MLRNNYSNSFLAILLLSVFSTTSFAQTNVSSPYSRYGLGNISETAFHGNRGMSGLSLALRNPQSINLSNPASYSSFNMNSFVFEIGVQTDEVHRDQEVQTDTVVVYNEVEFSKVLLDAIQNAYRLKDLEFEEVQKEMANNFRKVMEETVARAEAATVAAGATQKTATDLRHTLKVKIAEEDAKKGGSEEKRKKKRFQ